MLQLVVAHGHHRGVIEQNIRGHKDRIVEEAHIYVLELPA